MTLDAARKDRGRRQQVERAAALVCEVLQVPTVEAARALLGPPLGAGLNHAPGSVSKWLQARVGSGTHDQIVSSSYFAEYGLAWMASDQTRSGDSPPAILAAAWAIAHGQPGAVLTSTAIARRCQLMWHR